MTVDVAHERLLKGEQADFFIHNKTRHGHEVEIALGGHRILLTVGGSKENGRKRLTESREGVPRD